jgi:hypothetical protein
VGIEQKVAWRAVVPPGTGSQHPMHDAGNFHFSRIHFSLLFYAERHFAQYDKAPINKQDTEHARNILI